MRIDLGIIVHNEEKNIAKLLDSILKQNLSEVVIDRIIVVSSGSTDKTNDIVTNYAKRCQKIKLLNQKRREGKASAINEFLREAKNKVVIISSGDIVFTENAIKNLTKPFEDGEVGLTSVNPIPVNLNNNLIGFIANMHWKLHNLLARHGEAIAFRKDIVSSLPKNIVADEAYIEAIVQKRKMKAIHVNDAIVLNKGPENIMDFIKQVRRHFFGHLQIKRKIGYSVSSLKIGEIKKAFIELIRVSTKNPLRVPYCIVYIFLEVFARFLGFLDFVSGRKNHILWDIAWSTKDLNEHKILRNNHFTVR